MADRVLLTGISGFVGGHIALQLLNAGYTVRGSLRDLGKVDTVRATMAKAGADVSRLEFVALDLLDDAGWSDAASDCRYLQHTASPFVLQNPRDPNELIRPAVDGTRRALHAALAARVERVVLTSSTAAIQYGHASYDHPLTEANWTNLETSGVTAYARSKTLAERQAWAIMDGAGRHNDLAVINPSAILGPLLDEDPGTSAQLISRLLDGTLPAVPKLAFGIIDVRDVAALHFSAMTDPAAGGQRCIGVAQTLSMRELAQCLKPAFPDRRVPTAEIPNWLVRLAALFSRDIRDSLGELEGRRILDGSRGPHRLGRPLIPAPDAVLATANSLIEHGLV
jgi:nucleoside-diphosphate-sugar epimerase